MEGLGAGFDGGFWGFLLGLDFLIFHEEGKKKWVNGGGGKDRGKWNSGGQWALGRERLGKRDNEAELERGRV